MVYFWSFSLFWCGIEESFFGLFFFLSLIEQCVSFFFEWPPLTVTSSPVGSAACTCTSQRVLNAVDRDTNRVVALSCLVVDRPTSVQSS